MKALVLQDKWALQTKLCEILIDGRLCRTLLFVRVLHILKKPSEQFSFKETMHKISGNRNALTTQRKLLTDYSEKKLSQKVEATGEKRIWVTKERIF